MSRFLPVCAADLEERGWDQCDFVYVCGDAYVDHPSFGAAIISRLLEANGYKVGMICQPDWHDPASVAVLGEPRLGFLVSAGNMDSLVNHCTVAKKRRGTDSYSPGGRMGLRPDNATVVYGKLIRRTFKHTPIIVGGVEASLRRLAHYDYWSDKLKRSILLDSQADLLIWGMGEKSVVAVADALAAGIPVDQITYVPGTVWRTKDADAAYDAVTLPAWEALQADKLEYARSFKTQYRNLDPYSGKCLVEPYERDGVYVVQNPAQEPLTTEEMDAVYGLPFARTYHPMYEKDGGVPAIREVKFSLTSNRGCFGECAFCSLAFHQGRIIQSRSHESLLAEARLITADPEFKGYIHDVGGPTADFRKPSCPRQLKHGACPGKRCLSPKPCKSLQVDHADYLELLRKLRALPGVKKVFVRSGIRFDYALLDRHADDYIRELAEHHVSGQLRLAPEHVSDTVLQVMGKPANRVYQEFVRRFDTANQELGLKQFAVPYLMSSHPGSTLAEAVELAEFCRDMGFNPEQVQDFYPTPSTISTCIYYTGVDPRTMKPVYCPRSPHEKALQRALIQYRNPKNRDLVREALVKAGRQDLIGFGPECLVRPAGKSGPSSPKGGSGKGQAGRKKAASPKRGDSPAADHKHGAPAPGGRGKRSREEWSRANARNAKGMRGQQYGRGGGKGMGPNKASGHKGGISRQGSKR
ncbi:MAG: YgiQ family radical SAM protein [Coriobacteriia bacterium]|nr:YgiQ family radical SAM protein [Coriobacteriia bacterium]